MLWKTEFVWAGLTIPLEDIVRADVTDIQVRAAHSELSDSR